MSDDLTAGRLEDRPFPALAGRIFHEGRTGGLTLESGGRRRTVWFVGGNPAAVISDDPQDHLAHFLREHGRIGEEEYARLAALPETREGLARADFLPKETLNWGVKFRFVNLCYDLFRWEEGDFEFTEGTPPRELSLLKVPAHSLILKGVGYLGNARLIDLVPDESSIAVGEVSPEQARYLGPAERQLLDACRPGSTVDAALGGRVAEDAEHARALLYAFVCLGLVALGPATTIAPAGDEEPFALDEPLDAPLGDSFGLPGGGSLGDGAFSFEPPEPAGAGAYAGAGSAAADLEAALASTAGGPGRFPFEDDAGGGSLGSFDDTFSGDSEAAAPAPAPPPAPARKAPSGAKRVAGRKTGGSRLPRLAGIAIGTLAAGAVIAGAAWWWLGGGESPPPPPPVMKKPAPATPPVAVAPTPAATVAAPVATPAPAPLQPAVQRPAAPAPTQAQPAVAASAAPALNDRYRNGLDVFRAGDLDGAAAIWEDLLALQHRGDFTLLLLTACQRETIRDAQKTLADRRLYLVPKQVNGRGCFRVCVDTYASREEAARALAVLPAEFRSAGATVRPVADVLANR